MDTIGARIREERDRLGLSQEEFAALGGVRKRAQIYYEQDERCPDGHYFAAIAAAGADVTYVLTGARSAGAPAPTSAPPIDVARLTAVVAELEAALKRHRRLLDPQRKARAVAVLYDYFTKAGPQDAATVDNMLELMS